MHELKLDQEAPCFQYKDKVHSNYFDSNLGSVKSILTNTFFGIKHVTGIGDCGFLCLMIGINSCKQRRLKFNKNVEEFYKNELRQNRQNRQNRQKRQKRQKKNHH